VLGGQVSREKTMTARRELPVEAPLTAVISPSLDDLEKVLLILTEQCKKELKAAETPDERSKILERYKLLLQRETGEMLAGIH